MSQFDKLTPAQQAELLRKLEGVQARRTPPLVARSRGERPVLSYAQQRMWFLQQLHPESSAYNIVLARRLRGPLDVAALGRALAELAARHEALRTVFPSERGEPYQQISEPAAWPLAVETGELAEIVRAAEQEPFDLATGPLVRTRLVRLGADDHVLVIAMHHIVSDGWSMTVFWRELAALLAGRTLPPLPVQYADYAAWQRGWLAGDELERQLAYWKQQLRGAPEQIELPFKGPRPRIQTFEGRLVIVNIAPGLASALRDVARREGTTLFITLLAGLRTLLARYTGQDDISIGTPIANRGRTEIEGLIGLFMNTLVLRGQVALDDTFRTLLAREKQIALAAYDHMATPFELIVDALGVERSLDRPPLFQVMYAHEGPEEAIGEPVDTGYHAAKVDLSMTSVDRGDTLHLRLTYNVDLFDGSMIEQLAAHLVTILGAVARDPARPLARIPLAERPLPSPASPPAIAAPALIAAQVERTPDAIALVFGDQRLTYRELDARANRLAHHLASQGAARDQIIAVQLERSLDLVVALLAVWKTGAAYLPIDPHHPEDRRAYIIADAGALLVITEEMLSRGEHDAPMAAPTAPDQLAYVLYTSGSTGRPKGVAVPHGALAHFLAATRATFGVTPADTLLAVTTVAFDIAGLELWLPLTCGARVAIASTDETPDPARLARRLESATMMQATPATWRMLLDAGWLGRPELVALCGGEALPADLAQALHGKVARLWNLYGPTETTIWSAAREVPRGEAPVRIGGPLGATRLHVLDRALEPTPPGVAGELYIAGPGVARGYHRRPELTTERFLPDPFGPPGSRMYRTGDRVRRRDDGTFEFLGRLDHQVKLRGFRIELGEIESVIASHPTVRQAVVILRDGQLVAYVVPSDGFAAPDVRAHAAATLPDYMIPAALVALDAFPLSPSGKLDRAALPAPSSDAYARAGYVAPRTELETAIARIWSDLLGVERVGIHDDFFALGGDSLRVIRLIAEIERACGVRIPVRSVFERATVEAIAVHVAAGSATAGAAAYVRTGATTARATVSQEYFYYLDRDDHDPESYFITNVWSLEGPLDAPLLARAYAEVVGYHEAYRTRYREVDGVLQQVVHETPPAPLEIVDASPEDLQAAAHELVARDYDLDAGTGLIRARLLRFAPDRHALVLIGHHIIMDGGSAAALRKQLFEGYRRLRDGAASALPPDPPLQYIDFAIAREQRHTAAQDAFWRDRLAGASATILDGDFPRAPIEAHRDTAALGITADISHPPETVRLPDAAYAAVVAAARAAKTTPFVGFLSGLYWLLHERSGQRDLAVQATYTPRAQDPALEPIQGALTTWTVFRTDLGTAASLRDVLPRTAAVVEAVHDNGTPHDFYRMVPHGLRRVVFNYIPFRPADGVAYADVTVKVQPWPFPPWKRPWDLHLTMIDDGTQARVVWTGFSKLFRRETVVQLLERYIATLQSLAV